MFWRTTNSVARRCHAEKLITPQLAAGKSGYELGPVAEAWMFSSHSIP
jgi:hypothetical protein